MIENNPHVQVLASAIKAKAVVAVKYDGKERLVEPHAVGANGKGEPVLRGWQSFEVEGSAAGWKLMKVDKMEQVASTNQVFGYPRPGYKQGDSAIKEMVEQL